MSKMTGAEVIVKALNEQGVDHIFGYPGGAVLPLYDELFKSNKAPLRTPWNRKEDSRETRF